MKIDQLPYVQVLGGAGCFSEGCTPVSDEAENTSCLSLRPKCIAGSASTVLACPGQQLKEPSSPTGWQG